MSKGLEDWNRSLLGQNEWRTVIFWEDFAHSDTGTLHGRIEKSDHHDHVFYIFGDGVGYMLTLAEVKEVY